MKYRKKPVVIEALQFFDDPSTLSKLQKFMNQDIRVSYEIPNNPQLIFETFYGEEKANVGDFIIKGIGDYYHMEPNIFSKRYEVIEDETN